MFGISIEGEKVKLSLVGKFRADSVPAFKEFFETLLENGYNSVCFDLVGLRSLDGAGVAALVWANNQLREIGGQTSIINPSTTIYRRLLDIKLQYFIQIECDYNFKKVRFA
jgi:anti-anti-sigma factor